MSRKRIPDIDSNWFQRVFGFHEIIGDYNINQYRLQQMQLLRHDKTILQRSSDGMLLHCGSFELPSLYEMRQQCQKLLVQIQQLQLGSKMSTGTTNVTTTTTINTGDQSSPVPALFGPIHAKNIQSDAYELHANPIAANGIIQAASQFNCLEFPSPNVLPEHGINMYWRDNTQGPACAVACGAGTAFRNYLVTVHHATTSMTADSDNKNDDRGSGATTGKSTTTTTIGQRQYSQINTLDTLLQTLQLLHSDQNQLQPIHLQNGYAKTTSDTELEQWNPLILQHTDELRNVLKVGIQRHTQVTSVLPEQQVFVTQVYCSAIPVAYSTTSSQIWEPMARLILEGCYELTLLVGVREALEKAIAAAVSKTKSDLLLTPTRVFLTLVGGGVFGNKLEWIWSAIDRAFHIISDEYGVALEVYFVHYRSTSFEAEAFVHNWNQAKLLQ